MRRDMLPAGGAYVKVTLLGHATVLVETGPMRMNAVRAGPSISAQILSSSPAGSIRVRTWCTGSRLSRSLGGFNAASAGSPCRAYSRRYSTLCSIGRQASSVRVEAISLPDLLMYFTIYEAAQSEDAAKRRIDHEISQLRDVRG